MIFLDKNNDISELITRLGDRNTKARLDAANMLARLGNDALEPVTNLLNHDDSSYRRIAAYILGKIGNSVEDSDSVVNLVENLVESLGDDSPDVRKSAAQALNRIGKPSIQPLIKALGNISKDVRASAVWSLSKMGSMVVDPLLEVLNSPVKDVRASAVWALSKVGTPSIPGLIGLIEDPDKNMRESAIWGLSKIGTPAIEKLAEKWNVRIGSDALEGESETDSVDISDLVSGGESSIKQWIKFMIDNRAPKPEDSFSELTENEEKPEPDESAENE